MKMALLLLLFANGLFVLYVLPKAYRFLRTEYAGAFPFDWPVWVYRWRNVLRTFWRKRSDDLGGLLIVVIVLGTLWIGLIITA